MLRMVAQGDYGFVDLNPTQGHEQAGRRPVLVVSCDVFNKATGMVWVVPVTTKPKSRPQEVSLPGGLEVSGVLLLEHLRCIDPKARSFQSLGNIGQDFLDEEVLGRLCAVLTG